MRTRTLVSFHAHPDDEALFTGGTLARAAAEGHRVVLVVATDGEAGLSAGSASGESGLGVQRVAELDEAARALGVQRVVRLGFADSGWRVDPVAGAFSRLDPQVAAEPLARILREERADVLTTYDPAGGYGHPDHRQVHRVGAVAALVARTPRVLEATAPRELLHRLVRIGARVPGLLDAVDVESFAGAFTPRLELTHRVDVTAHLAAKRRALVAHASQATSDTGPRTLSLLLRLPAPLFRLVAGHEWYVDRRQSPGRRDDVFADLPDW